MSTKVLETKSTFRNFYLIGLLGILGLLTMQLFAPFVNIIIFAFVLVEIFYPVYKRLLRLIRNQALTSLLTTIIAMFVVVIPLVTLVIVTAGEAVSFTSQAQEYLAENDISQLPQQVVDSLNQVLTGINVPAEYHLEPIDFKAVVDDVGGRLVTTLGDIAGQLLAGGIGLLFQLFLLIISMIYLFQLRATIRDTIVRYSPFDDNIDQLFFDKFISTTHAVIKGSVFVALAQATAVIIPMALMGVGAPVLFWIIMVIASLIPVGSGIVWVPVGIVMILSGQPLLGILLIVYSAIIINVIDSLLRPYLMRDGTRLHPLLTLFSVLGGLTLFGVPGILIGPLITVLFISIINVYQSENTIKGKASDDN